MIRSSLSHRNHIASSRHRFRSLFVKRFQSPSSCSLLLFSRLPPRVGSMSDQCLARCSETLSPNPHNPPLDNGVTPLTETGAAQRKCGKKRQTVSKLAKKAVRVGEIIAISQVNNVNCGERSPHQKYHLQRKFLLTVYLAF